MLNGGYHSLHSSSQGIVLRLPGADEWRWTLGHIESCSYIYMLRGLVVFLYRTS